MDNVDRVKPITPDDVHEQKAKNLPDAVIATWNSLIAQNWNDNESQVFQKDVVSALEEVGFRRTEIFARCYLDVEPIYRAAGWTVHYDKPAYNETYDASFTFTKKRKK